MTRPSRQHQLWPAAVAVGVIALLAAIGATWYGVGLSRESVSFFHVARVLGGQEKIRGAAGLHPGVTYLPPLYPAMLAATTRAVHTLPHAARAINVTCFAAAAVLATLLAGRLARPPRSGRVAIAVLLFFAQYAVASSFLWATGEPPFLVLTLLAAYVLSGRPGLGRGVLTGGTLAAAVMTRYAGLALLPGACLTIWRTAAPGRRGRELAVVIGATLLPMIVLAVFHRRIGSPIAGRHVGWFWLRPEQWESLYSTLDRALSAPAVFGRIAWLVGIVLVLAAARVAWRRRGSRAARVLTPMAVSYLLGVVGAALVVEPHATLDDRMLAPAIVLLTIWLALDVPPPRWFARPSARRGAAVLLTVVAIAVVLTGAVRALGEITESYRNGLGFERLGYSESKMAAACRHLKRGAVVYSNIPEAVLLYGGHDALPLPGQTLRLGQRPEPLDHALTRMRSDLRGGGYVALFNAREGRRIEGTPMKSDDLRAALPLRPVRRFKDGVLFQDTERKGKGKSPATTAATTTTASTH